MTIIEEILTQPQFVKDPPVLVDIGASGDLYDHWKEIAPFSVCIAFDADTRDIGMIEKSDSLFRKLFVFPKVVTDTSNESVPFFLTRHPHCSSSLPPDLESLESYIEHELFLVDKQISLPAIRLREAFAKSGLKKIDWFKIDSQGTDLRLFKSLGDDLIETVLVADFEPGVMSAYAGEDKLYNVLEYMDKKDFWTAAATLRGLVRFDHNIAEKFFSLEERRFIISNFDKSVGWAEVTFFNSFKNDLRLTERDYMLGYVFGLIHNQYGFSLELAVRGFERFQNPYFDYLQKFLITEIRRGIHA